VLEARSVPLIRRIRHRVRTHVSEHPAMYLAFARHKYPGPSPQVISSDTELVIDGYTRCATTFAVYALQLSQPAPVRVAHHLHAPAQLIEAARLGVPALAVIREPRGAILSQLIREPGVALRDALIAYTRFYTCLLSYRHSLVIGEFEQVTHDFGSVVRRINARFGTSFAEFTHTDANLRECLDLIKLRGTLSRTLLGFESGEVTRDQLRREIDLNATGQLRQELRILAYGGKPPEAGDAWIPSQIRERAKAALHHQWAGPSMARLRDRAQTVYEAFIDETGQPPTG
jgi:hypothetical protein